MPMEHLKPRLRARRSTLNQLEGTPKWFLTYESEMNRLIEYIEKRSE
jgi:hypothetical protein